METLIQKIYKLFYNKPPTEEQVINDAIERSNIRFVDWDSLNENMR